MSENIVVDDGDVEDGEQREEADEHGAEKKLVAPDVEDPLRKVAFRVGLHAEKASSHVNHLPRQENGEPCKTCKTSCARAEHRVTLARVAVVAIAGGDFASVAFAESVQHEDKRC